MNTDNHPFERFQFEKDAIRSLMPMLEKLAKEKGIMPLSLIQGNPEGPIHEEYGLHTKNLIDLEMAGLRAEEGVYTNAYSPTPGVLQYRQMLVEKESIAQSFPFSSEQIMAVPGAGKGVAALLAALGRRSDQTGQVAVFAPFFPPYLEYIKDAGMESLIVPMGSDQERLEYLQKHADSSLRALILTSPNNPTGEICSEEFISDLGSLLSAHKLSHGRIPVVISDEPYRDMLRVGKTWNSIANHTNYVYTVVVNSFSKSMRLSGERVGYIAFPYYFPESIEVVGNLASSLNGDGTIQTPTRPQVALARTGHLASVDWSDLLSTMDVYIDNLTRKEFGLIEPHGGMYVCVKAPRNVSGKVFAQALMQQGVGVVPGEAFFAPGYVRLSLSTKDSRNVDEVVKRMAFARDVIYSSK